LVFEVEGAALRPHWWGIFVALLSREFLYQLPLSSSSESSLILACIRLDPLAACGHRISLPIMDISLKSVFLLSKQRQKAISGKIPLLRPAAPTPSIFFVFVFAIGGGLFRRKYSTKGHQTHRNYHLPHAFQNHHILGQDPKRPLSVRHPVDQHVITQFSYVYGSKEQPLLNDTVASVLENGVAKFGYGKELLRVVHQDIRWSWRDLKDHSDALSRGLIRLGYQKGDCLGVWLPNSAEWVRSSNLYKITT
jgi:hypothetical protein